MRRAGALVMIEGGMKRERGCSELSELPSSRCCERRSETSEAEEGDQCARALRGMSPVFASGVQLVLCKNYSNKSRELQNSDALGSQSKGMSISDLPSPSRFKKGHTLFYQQHLTEHLATDNSYT